MLADPELGRRMQEVGLKPAPLAPAPFATMLKKEREALACVVAAAGIKTE